MAEIRRLAVDSWVMGLRRPVQGGAPTGKRNADIASDVAARFRLPGRLVKTRSRCSEVPTRLTPGSGQRR